MFHHEGTKSTKGTKASALVLSHAIIGSAIEVHRLMGPGLLVEKSVVVEVKAVDKLISVHTAQLLTYLRLQDLWLGLLLNFNVNSLREGLRRVLNGW